ncbi:MAG TPA: porin family protein [Cytophagaceae bacterium]|jgi:hypothetical protein|nr:porin family protein [Cytophagaceae bacterium]
MKKIFILIIAFVMAYLCSYSEMKAQFTGGIRLGFNASRFVGNNSTTSKFAPGFHIGAYFRVAIKTKYRIQADVLFSTKGGVYSQPYVSGTTISNENYYYVPFYVDIPVMFNYKPVAGLYIEAGVQPSIALTQLNFSSNTTSTFNKSGLKSLDFAPVAGLGYEFKKVSLGIRGAFGIMNINSNSTSILSNTSTRNMTLMATFGFKI